MKPDTAKAKKILERGRDSSLSRKRRLFERYLPEGMLHLAEITYKFGLRRASNHYATLLICWLIFCCTRNAQSIVVYPTLPRSNFMTWQLAMLSGFKLALHPANFRSEAAGGPVARLIHIDSTFQELYEGAINGRCVDISKKKIDHIFSDVFGYSSMIDPLTYMGQAVRKSNLNFGKDGEIIQCPIFPDEKEDNSVYQKLIQSTTSGGLEKEYRACVIDGEIIDVSEKLKDPYLRFRSSRDISKRYIDKNAIFTHDEESKIAAFCSKIGLDVGTLDIIRCHAEEKMYIIDANKTSTDYAARAPLAKLRLWQRRADAFSRFVARGEGEAGTEQTLRR